MSATALLAACASLVLGLAPHTAQTAEIHDLGSVRDVTFPEGFHVVNSDGDVLKKLPDARSANARGYEIREGTRWYISDFSWEHLRKVAHAMVRTDRRLHDLDGGSKRGVAWETEPLRSFHLRIPDNSGLSEGVCRVRKMANSLSLLDESQRRSETKLESCKRR